MPLSDNDLKQAADWWDVYYHNDDPRWHWSKSPAVFDSLGRLSAGKTCSGPGEFVANAITAHYPQLPPFKNAVSVGCGLGLKEFYLLKAGLVEHFILYDLAPKVVDTARKTAEESGLGHAVTCICGDAFALEQGTFDLVYWDNSLHHMPSSLEALLWSKQRLARGGLLFINDYVGPNRFQFSDQMLALCNEAIKPLEISHVVRPDPAVIIKDDPTEAIDSAAIVPAMRRLFPSAMHIPLGGVIYFMALSGRPMKISEDVVPDIMALDKMLRDHGLSLYSMYLYKND